MDSVLSSDKIASLWTPFSYCLSIIIILLIIIYRKHYYRIMTLKIANITLKNWPYWFMKENLILIYITRLLTSKIPILTIILPPKCGKALLGRSHSLLAWQHFSKLGDMGTPSSPEKLPDLHLPLSREYPLVQRTDLIWKLPLSLDAWFTLGWPLAQFPVRSLPCCSTITKTLL